MSATYRRMTAGYTASRPAPPPRYRYLEAHEVNVALRGLTDIVLKEVAADLGLPPISVGWYRELTAAERAAWQARRATFTGVTTLEPGERACGFVASTIPTTVFIDADQPLWKVVHTAAHEGRHLAQARGKAPGRSWSASERALVSTVDEADAEAYAQQVTALFYRKAEALDAVPAGFTRFTEVIDKLVPAAVWAVATYVAQQASAALDLGRLRLRWFTEESEQQARARLLNGSSPYRTFILPDTVTAFPDEAGDSSVWLRLTDDLDAVAWATASAVRQVWHTRPGTVPDVPDRAAWMAADAEQYADGIRRWWRELQGR